MRAVRIATGISTMLALVWLLRPYEAWSPDVGSLVIFFGAHTFWLWTELRGSEQKRAAGNLSPHNVPSKQRPPLARGAPFEPPSHDVNLAKQLSLRTSGPFELSTIDAAPAQQPSLPRAVPFELYPHDVALAERPSISEAVRLEPNSHDVALAQRVRATFDEAQRGFLRDHHFGVSFPMKNVSALFTFTNEWKGDDYEFIDQELQGAMEKIIRFAQDATYKINKYAAPTYGSIDAMAIPTIEERSSDVFSEKTTMHVQEINEAVRKFLTEFDRIDQMINLKLPEKTSKP